MSVGKYVRLYDDRVAENALCWKPAGVNLRLNAFYDGSSATIPFMEVLS